MRYTFSYIALFSVLILTLLKNPTPGRFTAIPLWMTCGAGYTLAELLVVIGVIGVLAGMILPAVSKARRAADQTVCVSNLRQWGIATQLYTGDNHGYLPRRGQGVSPTTIITRPTDWFNALPLMFHMPAYMDLATAGQIPRPGNKSYWVCPEASDPGGTYYWSYAMNMGLSVWEANVNDGCPDKITSVGNTAVLVNLTDAPGNYAAVFPSVIAGGYNPVARHSGSVNICFLDSHVGTFPGAYVGCGTGPPARTDIVWHPPGNSWNTAH